VRAGKPAPLVSFPGALLDDPVPMYVVPEFETGRREGDPLSAIATAAVRAALTEARISLDGAPLDDVGLVMNTVLGPSTATEAYLERLVERGSRAGRPAHFVDTLFSMAASRVGIVFGLRGSTAVLGSSSAFELALDWVRSGRERAVVAGGAEYHSPKVLRYYRALAERSGAERALPGQGAAFVVIEAAERASSRSAVAHAELLGAGAASEPQEASVPWSSEPEGCAFAAAMRSALADAGLEPGDIDAITLAAGDDASEAGELAAVRSVFGEAPALLRPKRLFGEALGGAAGLGLLATLAALEGENKVGMVNAFEMGGGVTSLVLRSLP